MLRDQIILRLKQICDRYDEISALLSDNEIINNPERYTKITKEYSDIKDIVSLFKTYEDLQEQAKEVKAMLVDDELQELAKAESIDIEQQLKELSRSLLIKLLPKDPTDQCDIYLEIRAGTGGEEAALFALDMAKMYQNYIQKKRWQVSVVSQTESHYGGYKEIIMKVGGQEIFGHLKYESGGHRVQRIPSTESQGRVHTSACTVAILPVLEEIDTIDIQTKDLKIDTYRSSGAGGQHVNTTDSAVRITHLPTGIVVECQEERSQHKNKAKALTHLKTKILDVKRSEQAASQAKQRKSLVGSGDRSERIRTYNFPQNRVTDHRINLTLYQLDSVILGDLEPIITALKQQDEADKLHDLEQPNV